MQVQSEVPEDESEVREDDECEVWPEHWLALGLFLACWGQRELAMGAMGGHFLPARSLNVRQELQWLGFARDVHAPTVALYRKIEREALSVINERLASAD